MAGNTIATWGRRAGLVVAGLLFGLLVAEAGVRIFPPQSPVNVIRSGSERWGDVRLRNGTAIWGTPEREGRACVAAHPERQRVAVFGDSIPYGIGIEDNEAYTTLLEAQLNAAAPSPGFCVMNFAQPAFGFAQSWAIALDEIPAVRPSLVIWHFWNEQREYKMLGEAAYNVQDFQLRSDGFPSPRGGDWLPDGLNRVLFLRSALYRHLTLSRAQRRPLPSPHEMTAHWRDEQLRRVPTLAQSAGAPLIFVLSTFLDRPFPELQTDRRHEDMEAALREVAAKHDIPFYRLQDVLVASDYKTVRMDECCHLNAAGHAAMADALAPLILKRLHPDALPSLRSDQ